MASAPDHTRFGSLRYKGDRLIELAAWGTSVTESSGAPGEIRTPNPQIRSLVLYPVELRALDGHAQASRPARSADTTQTAHPRQASQTSIDMMPNRLGPRYQNLPFM